MEHQEIRQKKRALQSTSQELLISQYLSKKHEVEEQGNRFKKTETIYMLAKTNKLSPSTVTNIIQKYEKKIPLLTPGKSRKRKCPVTDIDDFTKDAIARFIYDRLNKGERVTAAIVHDHMKKNKDTFMYEGSIVSLRRILKVLGFKWGKEDSLIYIRESQDIVYKRTCFLREYMRNMESENPKPVVFLDETWIFMNGSSTYSWSKPGREKGLARGVMKCQPEGGRLVILHAGTKDGWIPGADLLFASNLKKGQDYHGAMNSESFQKWVQTQLIPGLRDLGPSIIILDNASYHNKLCEQQPTTKWNREQLMAWLRQNGISVEKNVTKIELQATCKRNQSTLKRYAVDEMLGSEGHIVLRLPPYHSMFNAIELVWSVTKGYYNSNVTSHEGHGLDRAKAVWKEALNQVTSNMWKREVEHTEKIIQKYYNEEVKNAPVVEDLIIDLRDSEEEQEDDDDDVLALPLEALPGTSHREEEQEEDDDDVLALPLEALPGTSK